MKCPESSPWLPVTGISRLLSNDREGISYAVLEVTARLRVGPCFFPVRCCCSAVLLLTEVLGERLGGQRMTATAHLMADVSCFAVNYLVGIAETDVRAWIGNLLLIGGSTSRTLFRSCPGSRQ
jgi:hypothetical protein